MVLRRPQDLLDETRALVQALARARLGELPAGDAAFLEQGVVCADDLAELGITRVGDLTGLDVIGVPVWFACRPNSRSLSVSQGKAPRPAAARLGAIMESLEQAFAERSSDLIVMRSTPQEMVRRGLSYVDGATMLRMAVPAPADAPQDWVAGISVPDGGTVYASYDLVGLDLCSHTRWSRSGSAMSSVGLAAALSLDAAVLHATLEVIENDATAMFDLFGPKRGLARAVEFVRSAEPAQLEAELADVIDRLEAASLACTFFELSGRVKIPTVAAFIAPRRRQASSFGAETFGGFACRFSPEEAALSALLEAVQSRLAVISGARDDIVVADYLKQPSPLPTPTGPAVPLRTLARPALGGDATPFMKLGWLFGQLGAAGIEPVILPLGATGSGIWAVRVLVSSLQSAAGNTVVRISEAMLETLLGPGREA